MPPPGGFAADLPSEWGGEVLTSFSVLRLPPPGGFAADLPGRRGGGVPLGFQLEENCVHDVAETLVGRGRRNSYDSESIGFQVGGLALVRFFLVAGTIDLDCQP